jgi:hypothetical protein
MNNVMRKKAFFKQTGFLFHFLAKKTEVEAKLKFYANQPQK